MTDHGPQRESIRDLMGRHGLDPNRMQSERDFIDMMQPYAEDLMTPASDPYNSPEWRAKFRADCNKIAIEAKQEHDELVRLRAENERYANVLKQFADSKNWHSFYSDRLLGVERVTAWDGKGDPQQLAADALRGEGDSHDET